MPYQQQPQYRQPNQPIQQPQQQYQVPYGGQIPQGYQQQPMKRMQRPPKRKISLDISSMISPKKRKFLLNLIIIGICFSLVYGITSFFVNHTEYLNSDVDGIDYMSYIGSDFVVTIIALIFLGFFYMILKGRKLNIENPYNQVNIYGQQPQQPMQQQQPRQQQPQYQVPQFMRENIQQPVQHIPANPKWNPPPNYWINPQQQQQQTQQPAQQQPIQQPIPQPQRQPEPQRIGSWKCPSCGNLAIGNFCNICGYGRRTR